MALGRVGGAVCYSSLATRDAVDGMQIFANGAALLLTSGSGPIPSVKLPNGEQADLGTKLEDYSLNPFHRDGRHKARVFQSALGITRANADLLRSALEQAAATSENAVHRGRNSFGEVYELRLPLATTLGAATVLSAWIVRRNEDFPRLITCFIV